MKVAADKHRREVDFAVGSWVYVKLQPYRQTSLSGEKYHKLSKRYYGPYLIVAKVGAVAYRLGLPPQSRIHNVFHCSLLKPHTGPPPSTVDQLPPDSVDNHPLVTPLAVLAFQIQMVNGVPTRFALVQWRGLLPDDTSWEQWEEFCHTHNLEDKVDFDGGNIDVLKPKKTVSMNPSKDPLIGAGPSHEPSHTKRQVKPPKKLEDYVTQLAASRRI
jgi:hypothetical protein